jgi:rRNA-processing protein FCF1
MRILLDTNIIIQREDDKVIQNNVALLSKLAQNANASIIIHPLIAQEIDRDSDSRRKAVMKSKLSAYPVLESPPEPKNDQEFLDAVGPEKNINDHFDNLLLYAVKRNAVDFLTTEDKGIQKKAHKIGIDSQVLSIDEMVRVLYAYLPREKISLPPPLSHKPLHDVDVKDKIFDSLRTEYPGFNTWFQKKQREGRRCWVNYQADGGVGAILIYKIEDEDVLDMDPPLPKNKRVKICTMKVEHTGQKIGELFIKLSHDLAIKNRIEEIYLTHYTLPASDYLVDLISDWGFHKVGVKKNKEDVYLKKLIYDPAILSKDKFQQIPKVFYPTTYDGPKVSKFIIPIQPQFHDRLFVDFQNRQTALTEFAGEFISEGNTIKKAYLCNTSTKRMKPGDIILFYRSGDQLVTSIGTIDEIYYNMTNPNEIFSRVAKRTVYSIQEIEEKANRPVTVILFIHNGHLPNPIRLDDLIKKHVFQAHPQSIQSLSERNYQEIKRMGRLDPKYSIS